MSDRKSFVLSFIYNYRKLKAVVIQDSSAKDINIFKIQINYGKYYIINHEYKWKFISDLQLCDGLKNVLIENLEPHLINDATMSSARI